MNRWKLASSAVAVTMIAGLGVLASGDRTPLADWWQPQPEPSTSAPEASQDDAAGTDKASDAEAELENQLAGEFARVADLYEASSQYPSYSLPIDENTVDDYRHNQYSPVDVPFSDDEGEARVRILLERLHFEHGEPIVGLVAVTGSAADGLSLNRVTLRDQSGETLYSEDLEASGDGAEYTLTLTPSEDEAQDWPGELFVMVTGDFRNRTIDAVAPVRYQPRVGEVSAVGASRVEGDHLMIPVELDLEEAGYYAVSGNLHATDGRPLVHLEGKEQLSDMDNEIVLRAHRQALEAADDEGPYQLEHLVIRKLPGRPGEQTRVGRELEDSFEVEGASFDRYSGEPYEDPMREARLEFLRGAASDL